MHKGSCRAKLSLLWYDRYRKCKERGQHDARHELMTWPSPREWFGWGGYVAEESDDLICCSTPLPLMTKPLSFSRLNSENARQKNNILTRPEYW